MFSNLNVDYRPIFLTKDESDSVFLNCEDLNLPNYKRSTTFFGDKGLIYTVKYKEKTSYIKVKEWPEWLITYKNKLEKNQCISECNFCAVMKYPNGEYVIKKHRDKEMVTDTSICGISVGATRRIMFTPCSYTDTKAVIFSLPHGSLYCMLPPTNNKYVHEILPETKDCGVRYSLTFRNIPSDVLTTEIPLIIRCTSVLKSGNKKGEMCNAKTYYGGDKCGRHKKNI